MPPKEELFVPFEHELEVRKSVNCDVLEWKQIEGRLFFRPKGVSPEITWFHHRVYSSDQDGRDGFARLVSYFYRRGDFCRIVPLDEISEIPSLSWLLCSATGQCWLLCNMMAEERNWEEVARWASWTPRFDWTGDRLAFLLAPHSFFIEKLTQSINENGGELVQVIKWLMDDGKYDFWSRVSWRRGHKDEWLVLINALLLLINSNESPLRLSAWPIFIIRKPKYNLPILRMSKKSYARFFPAPVWELLKYAENYFEPRIDYRNSFLGSFEAPDIIVPVEEPTSHELMGAFEIWREFGRKSGQVAEVEACLSQLLT
ncbi:hypothetical protein EON83_20140 [bacterium]|nr:MAG: hypothetical protein EON83_20140 [bacterium]